MTGYNPGTNRLAVAIMLDCLSSGPHTAQQLSEATGLHQESISMWLRVLAAPSRKLIYIARWDCGLYSTASDRQTYQQRPAYAWGSQDDAPKPERHAHNQKTTEKISTKITAIRSRGVRSRSHESAEQARGVPG